MENKKNVRLRAWSAGLCNISMIGYILWLFLPVVQYYTGLRAGLGMVALFGIGLLLDAEYLRAKGVELLLRLCAAALLPIYAFCGMHRGIEFLPFFCQNGMLWFPPIFCAYVRFKNDRRLTRCLSWTLLGVLTVTSLITIGWDLYCRQQQIETYSRIISMGWVSEEMSDFIMRHNIGGYDFVYALLLALPLVCALCRRERGALRWAWMGAALLILLTLAVADFSLPMLAGLIVMMMILLARLLRFFTRKARRPLSVGMSMLCTVPVLLLIVIFRMQLIDLGAWFFGMLGLKDITGSFEEMRLVFSGQSSQIANDDSRLIFFGYAWNSFTSSPLIGTLGRPAATFAGKTLAQYYAALGISGHSDVLDILAGMGLFGAITVPLLIFTVCRGAFKDIRKSPSFPYVMLMLCTLFALSFGCTFVYSREITVIVCVGVLLLSQREQSHPLEPSLLSNCG